MALKNVSIVLRPIMDILTKILSASSELFRQYGFKTITMDDIARRAGISKKTLYQHFANKQEVVNESVIWYKNKITDNCSTALMDAENAVEAMVRLLAFMDNSHKQMNPIGLFELQRYFPDAYETFRQQLLTKDVEMMRQNIVWGMEDGLYRSDLDAGLLARFRLECAMMILQPNLMVTDRGNLLSVTLEIGENFMYGIMTPKGIQLYISYKEKYLKQHNTI